jgi:hypothetical protein
MPVVPPAPGPGSRTSTTTTVEPSSGGDHREITIHKEVNEKGNTVTEKDIHKEGVSGSTETHTKRKTQPDGGTTTTRSKITTKQD